MAEIPDDVFANVLRVVAGNLRNGDPATIARTARASSIPAKYYWNAPVWSNAFNGNPANREAPLPAGVLIDACIRSAFGRLVQESVRDAETAHILANAGNAAAPAFVPGPIRDAARANPALRVEAILIGGARAAAIYSYAITQADLIATESRPAILAFDPPGAVVDDDAYAHALENPTAGWSVRLASGNAANNVAAEEADVIAFPGLSVAEFGLAFAAFSIGQASPVRAGAQLYMDGHHYHSDESSSARHRAIETEVLGKSDAEARALWTANRQMARNAVWHAAIHPIIPGVLQAFAEDGMIVERLNATGFGSMSVGLPAQEDLFRRAGSYTAVLDSVRPVLARHGHDVKLARLEAAVTALQSLPRTGALPATRPALPDQPAAAWPAGCVTRAQALNLFLLPYLTAAEPVAAWLFGFYSEICANAGIRRNTQEGSLLRSYSLRRAQANHVAQFNEAQNMYRQRARMVRAAADAGQVETYVAEA